MRLLPPPTAGVVEAPVDTVADLVLRVRPGPVCPDNAFSLYAGSDGNHPPMTLTGGPCRFVAAAAEPHSGRMTIEVDRANRTLAVQGGWWYRGETSLHRHEHGTLVVHRVRNVARWMRWGVPLVLLQYRLTRVLTAGPEPAGLRRIGEHLGCSAYVLPTANRAGGASAC